MSTDRTIDWKVVYEDVNPLGSFTCQVVWLPPAGNGFIVQYVSVDDPLRLLPNYDCPYFEAWKVQNGKVIHEGRGSDEYDDSFSNCADGFNRLNVGEKNADKIKAAGLQYSHVTFNCKVFWVEEDSEPYDTVSNWKRANEIGITMAGALRASYDAPSGLDKGMERLFVANFDVGRRKDLKFYKVENQIVVNGNEGKEIISHKIEDGFRTHIPVAYQKDNEFHVKVESEDSPLQNGDYIQWLTIETDSGSYQRKEIKAGDKPEVEFVSLEHVVAVFGLCNLHGLWKQDIIPRIYSHQI